MIEQAQLSEYAHPLEDDSLPTLHPVQGCGGRCWGPAQHPGQFRWWNGQQNGCMIQVWRQFGDGCTHYQMFNQCYQVWDPQIYWTCCVH
jgi:hypothetical protein